MLLADIIERARERLDEDLGASSQRYTTTRATEIVYLGARTYVAKTGCQYSTVSIFAEAYTLLYDLPCDLIQIERVGWYSGTTWTPLVATTPRELDATEGWWQRRTDTRSRAYFAFGLDKIGLWPVSTTGDEQYIVEYQLDVGALTTAQCIAAVPVEDHECLVNYAVGRFLLEDQKVPEGMAEINAFRACVEAAKLRRSSPDRAWVMR